MGGRMSRYVWLLLSILLVGTASAQISGQQPDVFKDIGISEKLGSTIPGNLTFRDEQGKLVRIGDLLDGKRPVLLNLVYYSCPMLCNLLLDEQTSTLKEMAWTPGQQYEIITISFAPWDTPQMAAEHKARYLRQLGKPAAATGWHFLTGDEASIRAITQATGFKYKWVEEQKEFAHPAALIMLSGEGKITRYLYGLEHSPRDVRTALVEASQGKVGNVLDQVILFCFHYDANARGYVLQAKNVMKASGLLTMLALGSTLLVLWRREKGRQKRALAA